MKILFEGCKYATTTLEETLNSRFFSPANDPIHSMVDYVGYYYNSEIDDAVIVLPKVFVYQNGLAFGKYDPEEILNGNAETKARLREDGGDKIMFDLSTWLYQAIIQFRKRQPNSSITEDETSSNVISNLGPSDSTKLDIILSLIRFHKENQQLFTYVAKLNHTGQKIHWNKTVSKHIPHISDNIPIYTNTISKKKAVDFDESLIVIFYSVLNYLNTTYSFRTVLNQNYDLITGREFKQLLQKGTRKLKSIKNKYFTDKFVALWKLLYAFFERAESIKKSNRKREEVLLVRNFNLVFEDMIDDLIGETDSDMPRYFTDQLDGKQVDHIYRYKSLIINDDIYFVGDSKYYKPANTIGGQSIAKQHTYAKNVIQYNIDLFNKGKLKEGIRYRDNLTEGYNITPNFFISALVDPDFDFKKDGLEGDDAIKTADIQFHYADRLFDRDTLLIQHYNINFLFVLSAYISRSSLLKQTFKSRARKQFRDRMIEYFNAHYTFYEVYPKDIDGFVTKYFRVLAGKMYRSSQMNDSIIIATAYTSHGLSLDINLFIEDCKEINPICLS